MQYKLLIYFKTNVNVQAFLTSVMRRRPALDVQFRSANVGTEVILVLKHPLTYVLDTIQAKTCAKFKPIINYVRMEEIREYTRKDIPENGQVHNPIKF